MKKDNKNVNSFKFTILYIVLIAVFCIAIAPKTLQNDTYYTIKIGEHIEENGIDMEDPFSWHEDLSYTYPHWGYDYMTYKIYNSFGMLGIYVSTCILSAILGITIYLVNSKLMKNQLLSFAISIASIYLLKGYIAARAQLVTFILFSLTILFIEKFLETKKKRYALGLICIPILIANLHLAVFPFYFILYLPYIAEYIIACYREENLYRRRTIENINRKIKRLEGKNNERIEELKKQLEITLKHVDQIKSKEAYKIGVNKNDNTKYLIMLMILCLFTGFLTPLGTTPYTYLVRTMIGNTTHNISEHLPAIVSSDLPILAILVLFIAILTFSKAKIRLSDLFMIIGLGYLMLLSRRQMTMFILAGGVIINRLFIDMIMSEFNLSYKEIKDKVTDKVKLFVTVIIIIVIAELSYKYMNDKSKSDYIDETAYPVHASDFILEEIDLETARIYNEYEYGSYLIFRGIPVFIDSRADLYAPEFSKKEKDIFTDYIDTTNIIMFYEDTFEKYNITHIINRKDSKISMIIDKTKDPKYNKIYEDDYFVIYERLSNI